MNTITFARESGETVNATVEGVAYHGAIMSATLEDGTTTKVQWDGLNMLWKEVE